MYRKQLGGVKCFQLVRVRHTESPETVKPVNRRVLKFPTSPC